MEKIKRRLGLVSVSFRQHTPREILEAMKQCGLSVVEWGSDIHAPCTDLQRLYEIGEMQTEYGVACSSYGTYFRLGETPLEELEDCIHAAKILGTDTLRLWCGRKSGADMTDAERVRLISDCRWAADIARMHGVRLCMECHIQTFTERTEDAVWLMREVNSPHFRMYWQPNQFRTEAENLASAKSLSAFTEIIHAFNWEGKNKYPLADAADTWRSYLDCFDGVRGILLEFMPDGRLSTLAREAEALYSIVGFRPTEIQGER